MIQDLNKEKVKSNCFLFGISKPYSGKAVILLRMTFIISNYILNSLMIDDS